MSRAVWWFPIEPGPFLVEMPADARMLGVRSRDNNDGPVIYAEVNTDAPKVFERFVTIMTGEEYRVPLGQWDYLGTVQVGWVVGHVFYAGPDRPGAAPLPDKVT